MQRGYEKFVDIVEEAIYIRELRRHVFAVPLPMLTSHICGNLASLQPGHQPQHLQIPRLTRNTSRHIGVNLCLPLLRSWLQQSTLFSLISIKMQKPDIHTGMRNSSHCCTDRPSHACHSDHNGSQEVMPTLDTAFNLAKFQAAWPPSAAKPSCSSPPQTRSSSPQEDHPVAS